MRRTVYEVIFTDGVRGKFYRDRDTAIERAVTGRALRIDIWGWNDIRTIWIGG